MTRARFIPVAGLAAEIESLPGVVNELDEAGNRIARTVVITSAMAARHRNRYGPLTVTRDGKVVTVAAHGSVAHLDEWGSANNSPKASMRRAAAREGRFTPE